MQRSQQGYLDRIRRKGSGLLRGVMGGLASGGSAKANPAHTDLIKYGAYDPELDAGVQPFIPSGNNIFGQSTQAADELNNRIYSARLLADYQDQLQRGFLPYQLDEQNRANIELTKATGAITDERAANTRRTLAAEEGAALGQGMGALSEQELMTLLPNNRAFTSPEEQANVMRSLYPQIGDKGLKGVVNELPSQNAKFQFETSPEGQKTLADNVAISANEPLLKARHNARFQSGNTIYEPTDPIIPAQGGFEFQGGSTKVINRKVPIPQSELEKAAGMPVKYMDESEISPIAPSYNMRGSSMPISAEEYDSYRALNGTSGVGMGNVRASESDMVITPQGPPNTAFSVQPDTGKAEQPPPPQLLAPPSPLSRIPSSLPMPPSDTPTHGALIDVLENSLIKPGLKYGKKAGKMGIEIGDMILKAFLNDNSPIRDTSEPENKDKKKKNFPMKNVFDMQP